MNAFAATREHYRLSQQQWAQAFGVARSTVSAWEIGEAAPPPVIVAAYRQLQEPILQGDLGGLEATRQHILRIAAEAEQQADQLNRGRPSGPSLVKVVAVTAAAIAIGRLLAHLFGGNQR